MARKRPAGIVRLFSLRLWPERLSDDQSEWRGQITRLPDGEVRYFRDAATLYDVLKRMLEDADAP